MAALPKGATKEMQYKSLLITAVLLVSMFGIIAPAIPAMASTGHADLAVSNNPYLVNASTTIYESFANVSVKGGSSSVVALDGAALSGYLVINLTGVTFSGSQFFLYISTDGLAQISGSDFQYAGPFNVADLSGAAKALSGGYSIGSISGNATESKLLEGPIPTNLSGGNYYVKIFDGSSTSVAVTAQFIQIVPNLVLSPTSGPAGGTVTASGYGYSSAGTVNITYGSVSVNITASSTGGFNYTFQAPDLGTPGAPLIYDSSVTQSPAAFVALTVTGYDYGTGLSASANYNEFYRDFAYIVSLDPAGNTQTVTQGPGGNAPPPYSNDSAVNAYVLQEFDIAGDWWNPTANLSYTFDGSPITPVTSSGAPNATGYFWANFTVPIAALGPHHITVFDATANMSIELDIQTTFLVTPTQGPEGTTVTGNGYGFTASTPVTAWWFGTVFSSTSIDQAADNILLFNGTTSSNGAFSFTFTVPSQVYGGSHDVFANDSAGVHGVAAFDVTTSWSLSSGSGALGSSFSVVGQGIAVGVTTYYTTDTNFSYSNGDDTGAPMAVYYVSYDNAFTLADVLGNDTGYGSVDLTAAGVPMVHYVGVWSVSTDSYTPFPYSPFANSQVASLPFNVTGSTTEGAAIQASLSQLLANDQNIMGSLSSLSTAVAANGNAISGLGTQLTAISNAIGSLQTSVTQIGNTQATQGQTLASIQTSVGTLATQQGLTNVSSMLSNVSTYLLVAIVLAAIVLVLEIVILIRKK
jgi:hypothetical protein